MLYYKLLRLPFRCVRYEVLGCSSVIEIRLGVHWVKGLKDIFDFNDQSRKYNFLLFPLNIN